MAEASPPAVELDELIALFYERKADLGQFERKDPAQVPPAYSRLLAHQAHMTVTLEERHQCELDVEVLDSSLDSKHYIRKIVLKRQSDQRVVLFGLVRLALSALQSKVRDEILAQEIPLGRVLINNGVLRHVELYAVWQVEFAKELADIFECQPGQVSFGRTALIYCNGEPAVELLEIVAPEDAPQQ